MCGWVLQRGSTAQHSIGGMSLLLVPASRLAARVPMGGSLAFQHLTLACWRPLMRQCLVPGLSQNCPHSRCVCPLAGCSGTLTIWTATPPASSPTAHDQPSSSCKGGRALGLDLAFGAARAFLLAGGCKSLLLLLCCRRRRNPQLLNFRMPELVCILVLPRSSREAAPALVLPPARPRGWLPVCLYGGREHALMCWPRGMLLVPVRIFFSFYAGGAFLFLLEQVNTRKKQVMEWRHLYTSVCCPWHMRLGPEKAEPVRSP